LKYVIAPCKLIFIIIFIIINGRENKVMTAIIVRVGLCLF